MNSRGLTVIPNPEVRPRKAKEPVSLSPAEIAELFPNEDSTLLGNRIAALTAALGVPHCGGCEARRQWLNRAHAWLRGAKA